MLMEKAEIVVRAGSEEDFHRSIIERGKPLLASVPGVRSVQFGRGVEDRSKFMFLVEWESLEAHDAFSRSAVHPEFLALFAPHSVGGSMAHFALD